MKFKVALSADDRKLCRLFEPEEGEKVVLDADDPFIQLIVSQCLKDFGQSPDTIKVSATLDL